MILLGVATLLSSIIIGDMLLQTNSTSQELTIPPHCTIVTSFNSNSIVIFQGNDVNIHGNNIYTIGCKVINLQGKAGIVNNLSHAVYLDENIISLPELLYILIFPLIIIGGIIFISGILISMYLKLR
ncbi:hypothetical protein HS5_12710 [Acidianus sp. HS-5]|nr:hypothetical protein HS5_12710 [Acidianus sp. HS-5]